VSIIVMSLANWRVRSARAPGAKAPVPAQAESKLASPSVENREQAPVSLPIGSKLASPSVEVPEEAPISLPTGKWLVRPRGITGAGVLRIENGSGLDAVVKLVTAGSPRTTIWMMYVRADDHKSVSAIGDGNYLLRFALGLDWDADTKKFRKSRAYYQAGKQLNFFEMPPTSESEGKYSVIDITLNTVFSGNLEREPISENVFNEGDSPGSEEP